MLKLDIQHFGGRGARSSNAKGKNGGNELQPIAYNENWLYQPDEQTDLSDMRKNPIPFVGVGNDSKLGYEIEEETIQPSYESNVSIDVSKLKTLQPFVLQSGIDNPKRWDDTERPYVVEYNNNYYLMDGNHRAAKAKLNGDKTIQVDVSHRVKK